MVCGRAQRGVCTAEDGRKAERSSAPYAEAYLPRFARTCLKCEHTASKKQNRIVLSQEKNVKQREEKKSEEKQRKEKKDGIKGLATKGKITR